jgi:hypothetical protein
LKEVLEEKILAGEIIRTPEGLRFADEPAT